MDLRGSLYKLSAALQQRVVPGLQYSQHTYESRLRDVLKPSDAWLDLGTGHTLFPEWRLAEELEMVRRTPFVVGIDPDFGALARHRSIAKRCLASISALPFRNEVFDIATANMVVEHLDSPGRQFAEVARVLKPGGLFIFHTPNLDNYLMSMNRMLPEKSKKLIVRLFEGRAEEDVYPTHYRANDPKMIAGALDGTGLTLEDIEYVNSTPVFNVVLPLLVPELLLLRQLQRPRLAKYRATIICRLRKR